MSWLSRLLGEMPEETEYKSSAKFKTKIVGDKIVVTEQPIENYKNEDAAQPFLKKYEERQGHEFDFPEKEKHDEIGSFQTLEDKIKNLNSLEGDAFKGAGENVNKKTSSLIGIIIVMVIVGFTIAIITRGFSLESLSNIAPMAFWIILILVFSFGKKKKK